MADTTERPKKSRHCVTGDTLPIDMKGVEVWRGNTDLGLLCEQ